MDLPINLAMNIPGSRKGLGTTINLETTIQGKILSIYLSIHPSIHRSTYVPIYLSIDPESMHPSTYLPTYLPIYLSIHLSTYLSIYRFIHPSIYVSILLKIIPKPVRSATPRFGRAVARVRSRHLKRQRKAAASFIRKALKGDDRLDMTKKSNQLWMEMANLKPIFQFLSKQ
jgi:hypothetical protein